jgi:hypothetical protein
MDRWPSAIRSLAHNQEFDCDPDHRYVQLHFCGGSIIDAGYRNMKEVMCGRRPSMPHPQGTWLPTVVCAIPGPKDNPSILSALRISTAAMIRSALYPFDPICEAASPFDCPEKAPNINQDFDARNFFKGVTFGGGMAPGSSGVCEPGAGELRQRRGRSKLDFFPRLNF